MIIPSGFSGLGAMGAATPTSRRTIVLDPLIVEGKIPKPDAPAAKKKGLPWKWIAVGGGLLGAFLLARYAKKKGRRGPLGVAA